MFPILYPRKLHKKNFICAICGNNIVYNDTYRTNSEKHCKCDNEQCKKIKEFFSIHGRVEEIKILYTPTYKNRNIWLLGKLKRIGYKHPKYLPKEIRFEVLLSLMLERIANEH